MYNETLVNRIREALVNEENIVEKKMFQGLSFMINCVSACAMKKFYAELIPKKQN